MALYFPPLFCGRGSTLTAKKDIDIEFDDGHRTKEFKDNTCIVEDIVGYGYDIKKDNDEKTFRIMNSDLPSYFNILSKVEVIMNLSDFNYSETDGKLIELQKEFVIKNVVKISKGQKFLHFIDRTNNNKFHDLFAINNNEKVLRMKDNEFEEYFKKLKPAPNNGEHEEPL